MLHKDTFYPIIENYSFLQFSLNLFRPVFLDPCSLIIHIVLACFSWQILMMPMNSIVKGVMETYIEDLMVIPEGVWTTLQ